VVYGERGAPHHAAIGRVNLLMTCTNAFHNQCCKMRTSRVMASAASTLDRYLQRFTVVVSCVEDECGNPSDMHTLMLRENHAGTPLPLQVHNRPSELLPHSSGSQLTGLSLSSHGDAPLTEVHAAPGSEAHLCQQLAGRHEEAAQDLSGEDRSGSAGEGRSGEERQGQAVRCCQVSQGSGGEVLRATRQLSGLAADWVAT
jgi:hypothetical protein